MRRRALFAFAAAAVAAPKALLESQETTWTTVVYPNPGHLYDAEYIHRAYGVPFGPVSDYHAGLIKSMEELWERKAAEVLNRAFFSEELS